VEPIYQSKFTTESINSITPRQCPVTLPARNIFIPNDLSILPLGTDVHPRKLFSSEYIEAFFKMDHEFSLPKAELNIRLYFAGHNTAK